MSECRGTNRPGSDLIGADGAMTITVVISGSGYCLISAARTPSAGAGLSGASRNVRAGWT